MIGTITEAWLRLASTGFIGAVIALLLLAFAVLIVGNVIIWTLAGMKFISRQLAVGFRRGWNR